MKFLDENKFLEVGKIVGTHGIRGEVKVEHWCDSVDDFCNIDDVYINVNEKPLEIDYERVHKSHVLVKFKNVSNKTEAEMYRGKILYALKNDIQIEPGRYFIADLKGCNVIDDETGVCYGVLNDIFNHGSVDIYSIINSSKKEYLLPIVDGTVSDVDLQNKKIFIKPLKGIFDEN